MLKDIKGHFWSSPAEKRAGTEAMKVKTQRKFPIQPEYRRSRGRESVLYRGGFRANCARKGPLILKAPPIKNSAHIWTSTYLQSWPLKCAQPIKPKSRPKQEGFAPDTYNKKCAPESGPTLQLDVPAPRLSQIALCAGKKEVIDPLNLRNSRSVKLRQGLTKCRDRHRQARSIICVSFLAITSSL